MIPKSQITINYTDGRDSEEGSGNLLLETVSTRELHIGYYIETNNGEYFAGVDNINLGEPLQVRGETMIKNEHPSSVVRKYNIFNDNIKDFLSNTIPVPTMKKYPTDRDYLIGYFYRFFSKRINSSTYQEIDEDVYKSINNKENKYDYNLYEIGSIKWHLTGNVYQKNANELKVRENRFPIYFTYFLY